MKSIGTQLNLLAILIIFNYKNCCLQHIQTTLIFSDLPIHEKTGIQVKKIRSNLLPELNLALTWLILNI